MPEDLETPDVFVSYPPEVRDVAALLARSFQSQGLKTWLDVYALVPGVDWVSQISRAIQSASYIVVLLGPKGISRMQEAETMAIVVSAPSKKVVPILLPGANPQDLPMPLRRQVTIDLSSASASDVAVAFDRLGLQFRSDESVSEADLLDFYLLSGSGAFGTGNVEEAKLAFAKATKVAQQIDTVADPQRAYMLGALAEQVGEYRQAERYLREALSAVEGSDERRLLALTYRALGIVAYRQGEYPGAVEWLSRALKVSESLEDSRGIGVTYQQLAVIAEDVGDLDQAIEWLRKCLDIWEHMVDEGAIAGANYQLGMLAQRRGDYDTAEVHYRQALEINERAEDQGGIAANFYQLGILAQRRGDYDTAEVHYRQALEINERFGDRGAIATIYHQLGALAQGKGDYTTAEHRYVRALEINELLNDRSGLATSYHQLGIIAQIRGDFDTAEVLYRKSLVIEEQLGNMLGRSSTLHNMGMLAYGRGAYAEAEARYRQELEINARLGHRSGMIPGYTALADVYRDRGDLENAVAMNLEAIAVAMDLGTITIGMDLDTSEIVGNIAQLSLLQRTFGPARFDTALDALLDADSKRGLVYLLAKYEIAEAAVRIADAGVEDPNGICHDAGD